MQTRKYSFGERSADKLAGVHPQLQAICQRVLAYGVMDFSVIEGHRSIKRQQKLFAEGKSYIDGVTRKGKHNQTPSLAVDLLPYPHTLNGVNVWADRQRFCLLAGLVHAAAAELTVKIRWGGDWDGDGNNADSNFHDLPHFELMA